LSFVEKNKAWLLPLLGLGVGIVGFLNYRSFTAAPAPAEAAGPGPATAPTAALPPVPVAPAPGPSTPAATGSDVWSDLEALAAPPAALTQEGPLKDRCRENLARFLGAPAAITLPLPGWVREAEREQPATAAAVPAKPAGPPPVPPQVEFIFSGGSGATAWVQGHPYRVGEIIRPGPFSVASIERARVGLIGPDGKTIFQVMQHLLPSVAGPRPSAEAP
jgi:hypothetical protein